MFQKLISVLGWGSLLGFAWFLIFMLCASHADKKTEAKKVHSW